MGPAMLRWIPGSPVSSSTPLDGIDLLLADLDGVVYKGPDAIPFAVESLNRAAQRMTVGYLTNNASRTASSVAAHLTDLGLTVAADDVVTSPQAAVTLLAGLVSPGATVLVIGGEGLTSVVSAAGFVVTDSADESPAAVIQGFFPEIGWKHLAEASFALNRDPALPWVATNTDWTIPVARGIAPGNGTLVAAVHNAVGRLPVVAGKPEVAIFDEAVKRFAGAHPLFIGDRLDTDILGANRAKMPSVLVLTGIDGAKQVLAADSRSRPTFILSDLRELHEPYPVAVSKRGTTTVRGATVKIDGTAVTVVSAGDRFVDLVRAGAAAIWNAGVPIHTLQVDESIYRESAG